ncbi:hypothetical protein [Salinisphaera sp.]|uniref:hypothetical protein n=1 Tax=Salinisphaera sp. TaxID=1914330 RepID=UPI0025F3BA81|nr:hypothetical protein [Salinisphaera sp.]
MSDLRRFAAVAILGLSMALGLAGCAGAPGYRFVDPAHQAQRYDGFLAYGAFADLAIEAAFEQALCDRLFAAGHACTPMLAAAPPTREQNAASRHAASRTSGAQATIVIELADMDTVSRRVIGQGRAAYNVRVIDNAAQQVSARFVFDSPDGARRSVAKQADALARRIVAALEAESLLYQR